MKRKETGKIIVLLGMIGQVTVTMLVPVFICTFLGWLVGKKIGLLWISVIGFFIGAVSGFLSVYKVVERYIERDKDDTKRA